MKRLFPILVCALLAVGLLWAPLQAQVTTGTLLGRVLDPSGLGIPGAEVSVVNQGTGVTRTTITDDQGNFTLSFLPREGGKDLAKAFLQASRNTEPERMPLRLSPFRPPVVEGALGWLSCRVRQEISTGDHDTIIGEVVEWGENPAAEDVLLLSDTGWHYRG